VLSELVDPVADLIGRTLYVQMQSLIDALWPGVTKALKAAYLSALVDHANRERRALRQDATPPPHPAFRRAITVSR
jgi:hypothetical protein